MWTHPYEDIVGGGIAAQLLEVEVEQIFLDDAAESIQCSFAGIMNG